jgi:tRNA A37 threonylcarbamoyltransferase TsaD
MCHINEELKMAETIITRDMKIEQLVELKEDAVGYLFDKNIRCIRCGEPVWDTIEDAARKKDYSEAEIDQLLDELNRLS